MRKIDHRLAFPRLAGCNAKGHPCRPRDRKQQPGQNLGDARRLPRDGLESHDDQGVAGQNRQGFAEGCMNRRPAAPHICIVETRQVIMDQ